MSSHVFFYRVLYSLSWAKGGRLKIAKKKAAKKQTKLIRFDKKNCERNVQFDS